MKRDVYKFLSGMFAGFAIEHAMVAVFISQGALGQPNYFGRDWGAGSAWAGAALYLAISLVLGYLGWRSADSSRSVIAKTMKSTVED